MINYLGNVLPQTRDYNAAPSPHKDSSRPGVQRRTLTPQGLRQTGSATPHPHPTRTPPDRECNAAPSPHKDPARQGVQRRLLTFRDPATPEVPRCFLTLQGPRQTGL